MNEQDRPEAPHPETGHAARPDGRDDDGATSASALPPARSGGRRWRASSPEVVIFLATLACAGSIALTALKLTGVVDWAWLWVLSPLWGVFSATLLFALLFGLAAAFAAIAGRRTGRSERPQRDPR